MKPDIIIGNPPYGGLDKKIIKKCIEQFADTQMVFLAPVRWLQEDYDEKLSDNIFKDKNVEVVDHGRHLWEGFDAGGAFDLAVYNINGNVNDYKKLIKRKEAFFGSYKNLTWEKWNGQRHYVPVKGIVSDHGNWWDNAELFKREWGYVANGTLTAGKRNGLTPQDAWASETNGKLSNWYGPKLKTAKEAKNFWDYLHLGSFMYFMKKLTVDVNVHLDRLPFPADFTTPWTDKMFYDYFNITKQEQNIIEKTIGEWNVQ